MTTMTIERETIHKMIDDLPPERENVLRGVYEILCEFDDEPLSDDEIAQIDAARAEVAAGEFWTLDEFNQRMAALERDCFQIGR